MILTQLQQKIRNEILNEFSEIVPESINYYQTLNSTDFKFYKENNIIDDKSIENALKVKKDKKNNVNNQEYKSLQQRIKEIILDDIKHIDLDSLNFYATKNKDVISYNYSRGYLDNQSIEESLENAIIYKANKDYNYLTNPIFPVKNHPDHLVKTDYFAYAIKKNIFSEKDLEKITFDHGESPEYYRNIAKDNLPKLLKDELLNPKEIIVHKSKSNDKEHPICSCGY